jgi:hypothetical protein
MLRPFAECTATRRVVVLLLEMADNAICTKYAHVDQSKSARWSEIERAAAKKRHYFSINPTDSSIRG